MENRAYAIAVGIFTMILGLGMVLTYWWMSGSQEVRTTYTINSQLPITGLSPEATVKFRGVNVGKVTEISLDTKSQTTILIKIEVIDTLKLSTEAYAELRRQGLTGIAYLDLNDESQNAPILLPEGIISIRPTLADNLMAKGPELISQFEVLLQSSSQLASSADHLLSNIDIEKLNNTIASFEEVSEKTIPAINSATEMLNNANKMISQENQEKFIKTLESVQQAFDATKPLINELSLTNKKFERTAVQIEMSTNQVANMLIAETLPQIHAVTQNMNQSFVHFNQLINALEDNPQSIIFGKPTDSPGPGEEGFTSKP
jgi:phospholipid/cholesterol/gamma-HCH transport system substrate-binding protein